MYWSIYDTLLLITGFLTAAIALIPIETIEARTRVTSALIGAGVVVLSLILGNMPSFTYPALVMIAPVLPVVAAGAIAKQALDRRAHRANSTSAAPDMPHQWDESAQSAAPVAAPPTVAPAAAAPPAPAESSRDAAWAELHDPSTSPERLAAIAAQHPEFADAIAAHPQAYDALRTWAAATRSQENPA